MSVKAILQGQAASEVSTDDLADGFILPIAKGGTGNSTGNATSATKLATARTIKTNLASTATASFNGTANVTPGVTGTLPVANGGTGNTTGNAASATKLATARNMSVNLASTATASFNGTAAATLGCTGTLPISKGGTGATTAAAARTALGINEVTVINNLTSTSTTAALSANQGRIIMSYLDPLLYNWDTVTWENLHGLCEAAQSGTKDINDYVAIGNTKQMALSSAVLGSSNMTWEVIDINKDFNGSITIQTKNTFPTMTAFGSAATWSNSTAKTLCQNIYNYSEAKNYIATVSKGTNTNYDTYSVAYTNETVFLPSIYEMGLGTYASAPKGAEYTRGVSSAYSKYVNNTSRIKYQDDTGTSAASYWTRSRFSKYSESVCRVNTDGNAGNGYYYYDNGFSLAPAAVIG